MNTQTSNMENAIGRSLITATYAGLLADTLLALVDRLAAAWRARANERAKIRERVRTARIVAALPADLRHDIGWPARYDEQSEG